MLKRNLASEPFKYRYNCHLLRLDLNFMLWSLYLNWYMIVVGGFLRVDSLSRIMNRNMIMMLRTRSNCSVSMRLMVPIHALCLWNHILLNLLFGSLWFYASFLQRNFIRLGLFVDFVQLFIQDWVGLRNQVIFKIQITLNDCRD